MCRPIWLVRGACPLKRFAQAFVACHQIVKSQNRACRQMFLFFPIRFARSWGVCESNFTRIAAFSRRRG
jgi:hypothetical protein